MQKTVFGVLVVVWITQAAYAIEANLSLAGEEVTWVSSSTSVCPFTVQVSSTVSEPVVLSGWQLRFKVIPDIHAKGEVLFDSFSTDADIFELDVWGDSTQDISSVITGMASDLDGVPISHDGMDILHLELTVSADASGRFDIAVLPSSSTPGVFYGAEWYDTELALREFDGIPFGGNPAIVGSVYIVPEPATVDLLLLGAMMTLAIECLRRHRRQHLHLR